MAPKFILRLGHGLTSFLKIGATILIRDYYILNDFKTLNILNINVSLKICVKINVRVQFGNV